MTEPETLWVPATAFFVGTGSPAALSTGSRAAAWLLDAAILENVRGGMCIPSGWSSARIDLVWANQSTGAGDAVFSVAAGPLAHGVAMTDTFDTSATGVGSTVAGTPLVLLVESSRAVIPGPWHVRVARQAANAADTLANDAAFVGLLLSRVA